MGNHAWELTTFAKPTYCDGCGQFIWGLIRQGYECKDCHLRVHSKCRGAKSLTCVKKDYKELPSRGLNFTPPPSSSSLSSSSLSAASFSDISDTPPSVPSRSNLSKIDDLDDFCSLIEEKYFHVACDTTAKGFHRGQILHLKQGDIIYRTCVGKITDGLYEGVVAKGEERGKVGTFSTETTNFVAESIARKAQTSENDQPQEERNGQKKKEGMTIRCAGNGKDYQLVWNSHGTSCHPYHALFWKVNPPPGYSKVSDIVEKSKGKLDCPTTSTRRGVYLVKTAPGEMSPLLAKPIGFELIYSSTPPSSFSSTPTHPPPTPPPSSPSSSSSPPSSSPSSSSSSSSSLFVWKIIPPIGFVSLGYLVSSSFLPPTNERVVCVRRDAAARGLISVDTKYGMLWTSRGSSLPPLSCWLIDPPPSQSGFTMALSVGGFIACGEQQQAEDFALSDQFFLLRKTNVNIDARGFPRSHTQPTIQDDGDINKYMDKVIAHTSFDLDELVHLLTQFQLATNSKGELRPLEKAQFSEIIPGIEENLLDSLFQAIDVDGDGSLSFFEYVSALSVMCRGNSDERVQFAFMICDLDGSGMVEREELKNLTKHLQQLARAIMGNALGGKYGNSDTAIDSLFKKGEESTEGGGIEGEGEGEGEELGEGLKEQFGKLNSKFNEKFIGNRQPHYVNQDLEWGNRLMERDDEEENQENEGRESGSSSDETNTAKMKVFESALSYQEFCQRAKSDPGFLSCFGLFDLFYDKILAPIEAKLYGDSLNQKEISGVLEKEKGEGVLNKALQMVSAYDKRYFVVRGGHLAYMKENGNQPLNIVNLTDAKITNYGAGFDEWFHLEAFGFSRALKTPNKHSRQIWTKAIRNNIFTAKYRYGSFAPIREDQRAKWYVNGCEYFDDLVKILPRAKHRVFISDWAFAPYLYLKRTTPLQPCNRIDNILLNLAQRGVKVYILIWYASTLGFDLRAKWVVSYMNGLHANIKAAAHPPWTPVIWSHHQKFIVVDDQAAFVGGVDLCFNRYDDNEYQVVDKEQKKYPGRDYNNLGYSGCGETNGPFEEEILDREFIPRMPWHDIHMAVEGETAMDVSYNFIQRWNHAMRENGSPPSWMTLPESPSVIQQRLPILGADETMTTGMCQVVRSVGYWSSGQTMKEESVYRAYESLIRSARQFIYIENQYFISSISRFFPENRVVKALYERIKYAILNKQVFRVIVILPVCPAGDIFAASTRYVMKYVYKTINRDKGRSLLTRLKYEFPGVDISNYISFHALRNYGFLPPLPKAPKPPPASHLRSCRNFPSPSPPTPVNPVTEQVYVHAKLMIVDDLHTVIGSANINDRSLLGDRDSELCTVTTDSLDNCVTIKWNGEDVQVGKFAHSLRKRLYRDYLGIEEEKDDIIDPICDESWSQWKLTSKKNTRLYSTVFPNLHDNLKTLGPLQELAAKNLYSGCVCEPEFAATLANVHGFLVDFPLLFLEDEALSPQVGDAELIVPRITFV